METKKTNAKQNNKGGNAKQQEPTKNAKEIKKGTTEPKATTANDTSGLGKDNQTTKKTTSNIKTHPAQTIKKLSIYEKLFNAQQTAGAVLKTGENTHHKYNYAKELDIIAEAKPIFKEQRLTYTFTTKERRLIESDNKKRGLAITFYLVNVDKPEEKIAYDIESEGENKDGSVVGIPVAYTMALKYFLAKALMLETGNDAELQNLEDKKKKGAGAKDPKDKPDPESEYKRSVNLIASTRNIDGLISYAEKVREGKFFNETQKTALLAAINSRVDELSNG